MLVVVYSIIGVSLYFSYSSDNPGLGDMAFLGDKYRDEFYWWELVIVGRKVLLMASFLFFESQIAMLLGTTVIMVALCIQIAASPYEDTGTEWSECFALVSEIFVLVSGPVFQVVNDPTNDDQSEMSLVFRRILELATIAAVAIIVVLIVLTQVSLWKSIRTKGLDHEHDDYKVRMVMVRLQKTRDRVVELEREEKEHIEATVRVPVAC